MGHGRRAVRTEVHAGWGTLHLVAILLALGSV
jgi:hypothetical protein